MATDIKRTWGSHVDAEPLATGSSVSEEGQCLVALLEGGVEKVKPSSAAAGETFAGFAIFRQKDFSTRPLVEAIVVPSAAPYEVELSSKLLIVGQVRVHDSLANTDLTVVAGAPVAGEAQVDHANGKVTFNAAEAGRKMAVYYRHNLTVLQSKALYYEAPTNYPDPNYFASVGVMKGKGRIYTAYYDESINWETAGLVIKCGADGLITAGGLGAAIPGARVVKAPSATDAHLGIEFNA